MSDLIKAETDTKDQNKSLGAADKALQSPLSSIEDTSGDPERLRIPIRFKLFPKKTLEINFKLFLQDNSRPFSITSDELCKAVFAETKGQVIALFEKSKELKAIMRRCYYKLLERKKLTTILDILAGQEEGKSLIGLEYQTALNRAKVKALSEYLMQSIELSEEELDEATKQLLNESRPGFRGLYVIVNKEDQARDIVKYIEISLSNKRSSSQVFIEAASQYAMPKSLEDVGGPMNEGEVINRFGNEMLDLFTSSREGACLKPIKLQKNNKWAVVWLQDKQIVKLNESRVYSHAMAARLDWITQQGREVMKANGDIQILVNEFTEADLEPKNKKLVLRVGQYNITNYDLYSFLVKILNTRNIKGIILSYPPNKRKTVLNYFFKNAMDAMVSLYVKASIAQQYNFDKEIAARVELDYPEVVSLVKTYARKLISEASIRDVFESKKSTYPKARVKIEYIAIESKKIADNLIRLLLNAQESSKNEEDFRQKFLKFHEDYSVDNNSIFEDREVNIERMFGSPDSIQENNKINEEDKLHFGSIHLYYNRKENLYYVLLKHSADEREASYEEVRKEILQEMVNEKVKEISAQARYEYVQNPN